jgi:hypothetical protein
MPFICHPFLPFSINIQKHFSSLLQYCILVPIFSIGLWCGT